MSETKKVDTTKVDPKTVRGYLFDSYEEAAKYRPVTAKKESWKVFRVKRPDGTEVYVWGFTGIVAVDIVARADGYDAGAATRAPRTVSQEAVNNALHGRVAEMAKQGLFTYEQLLAMGWTPEQIDALGVGLKPKKGK